MSSERGDPWTIYQTSYLAQTLREWDARSVEELLDHLSLVSDHPPSRLVRAGPEFIEFEWKYEYRSHVTGEKVIVLFENLSLSGKSIDCMFASRIRPVEETDAEELGFDSL